jgi:hypothetical protein
MTPSPTVTVTHSFQGNSLNVNVSDIPPRQGAVELSRLGRRGQRLWIIGLPIVLDGSLDTVLDRAVQADARGAEQALTSLDGAFAAFWWDPAAKQLLVVNDFAGLQPIYVRREAGSVAFAPRIDSLAGHDVAPEPAGWGGFVGFGNFIGERTSVAGVTRVPPATVIDYQAATDQLSSATYWRWPSMAPGVTLDKVDTGGLLDAIDASLRAYEIYGKTPTLLLSGGFESRLLAALLTRAGQSPSALTLRNPYEHMEIDGRFAARVARTLGLRHVVRDPDPDFFSTPTYLDYVRRHEIASTSVNLFIAQVSSELQAAAVEATWDGFPFGCIIKEKSGPSFDEFLSHTMKSFDGPEWRAARQVFAPSFVAAMRASLEDAVHREVETCHPAPHGTQQFFQRNRIRHRIAPNTLKVYAGFLTPFLPGLAKAVYERVVPIPPSVRKHEALYFRIFERHFPALARIPWCSGGHLFAGTHRRLSYRAVEARSAMVEHPRVGNLLRRFGIAAARPYPSCVSEAVQAAALDDSHLNADGIRALQRLGPTGTNSDTFARELVFYWTMWRSVMSAAPAAVCTSAA